MHSRVAYAFPVAEGQEADVRTTADALRDASPDFARTRRDLGLVSLSVWLQPSQSPPLVVLVFEGDLETYFTRARTEAGIDEWFRDKILQWSGSEAVVDMVYRYPQSELLFAWDGSES